MYQLVPDMAVLAQVAALPDDALAAYASVLDVFQLTPWNGKPLHEANPDGPVRRWDFGHDHAGQVIYLVLEEQQEVHLLLVQWLGA
ncbi:hypothetical protein GCM10011581_12310 [Saccharopolyspora subtropica]|uniref:Uncharacterized protein n=1 Tax=Saccharopolyspora thermophila TaxID=89367 RepID=A0A917JM31_9PSEU|nr:hypothetical protein [Saccharopolyspora subtropica]GGI76724.1 hypothetical protein GCM10011581_12310 [Saccharopolyspora subtropica]